MAACCYEVFDSPNGGKGLRATRVTIPNASTTISFGPTADHVLTSPQIIPQGQLIFEDLVPHVWYCTPDSAGVCCCACGKLLVLSKHTVQPCENESCSVSFCSPACSAAAPEHAFMCGSNGNVLQFAAHLESLRQTHQAQMSHLLGLALVAYAKIAIIFIQSRSRSPGAASESDHSPESSGRQFLLGYQTSDFCKIVHATRTHSLSYSKTLFEEIIAPAYYDAHLRAPLTTIRSIFESHQPWRGTAQQASFVKSELFSPVFFRNLIGCFSTNTLEVIVDGSIRGSALFCIFSKMNHACRKNTANVDCEAASVQVVASQVIECGEEITTTYRFDESGCQSAAAAYIARKRALDQYLFRCTCVLCAPHIEAVSPQGSDGGADSSGSCDSEDAADISNALADAAKTKADQKAQIALQQPQIALCDPETTSALLRAQKREAIRKAVDAQRAELDSGRHA